MFEPKPIIPGEPLQEEREALALLLVLVLRSSQTEL